MCHSWRSTRYGSVDPLIFLLRGRILGCMNVERIRRVGWVTVATAIIILFSFGVITGDVAGQSENETVQNGPIHEIPESALEDANYLVDVAVTDQYIGVLYVGESFSDDPRVLTYDRETGDVETLFTQADFKSQIRSLDESTFAVPDTDGSVRIYDAEAGEQESYDADDELDSISGGHEVSAGFLGDADGNVYVAVGDDDFNGNIIAEVTPNGLEQAFDGETFDDVSSAEPETHSGYITDEYVIRTNYRDGFFEVKIFDSNAERASYFGSGEFYASTSSIRVDESTVHIAGRGRGSSSTYIVEADLSDESLTEIGEIPDSGTGNSVQNNVNIGLTDRGTVMLNDAPDFDGVTEYDVNGNQLNTFDVDAQTLIGGTGETIYSVNQNSGTVYEYGTPQPENIEMSVDRNPIVLDRDDPNVGNVTVTGELDGETVEISPDEYELSTGDVSTLVVTDDQYIVADLFDGQPDTATLSVDAFGETDSVNVTVDYDGADVAVADDTPPVFESNTATPFSLTITNDGDVADDVVVSYTLNDSLVGFETRTVSYGESEALTGEITVAEPPGEYTLTRTVESNTTGEVYQEQSATVEVVDDIETLPDAEIVDVSVQDGRLSDGTDVTINATIRNSNADTQSYEVIVTPENDGENTTVITDQLGQWETETVTITPDEQPEGDGDSLNYTVSTIDDSAVVTGSVTVGPATFQNIGHPSFDTMDRALLILTDTTVIILFLITGASAMLASQTSGVIGSVLFTFLLLPAWLTIGVPLYLFAAALPAVVVFYSMEKGGGPTTEVRVEGV